MSTNKLPPVTRRRFLRNASLTLAAAGSAPALSAPFMSTALAADKSLSIVQWAQRIHDIHPALLGVGVQGRKEIVHHAWDVVPRDDEVAAIPAFLLPVREQV